MVKQMTDGAFQKIEFPDGRSYSVSRSCCGDPSIEFWVHKYYKTGRVQVFQGTYDECMDYITDQYDVPVQVGETNALKEAAKAVADENFHRELG